MTIAGPGARNHSPIVVVGAGVVGIATALYLRRDGHDVVVIDREGVAEGASKGNAGLFVVGHVLPIGMPGVLAKVPGMLLNPNSPLAIRWSYLPRLAPWLFRFVRASRPARVEEISKALAAIFSLSMESYRPLIDEARAHALVHKRGWMATYQTEAGFAADASAYEIRRRRGVKFDVLGPEEIRQLAPALAPIHAKAVYYPDYEHTTDPYRLTLALGEALQRGGGRFVRANVTGFERDSARVSAVVTDGGPIACRRVVIAAGSWSRRLTRLLGIDVPLDTERGYHVMMPMDNFELRLPLMPAEYRFSITPMAGGLRLAGTVEFAGLDSPADPRRWSYMIEPARRMIPALRDAPLSRWMGFRPSMPDSMPVIGPAPGLDNVDLAFGHGHCGLTLAAVTGRLIADSIARRRPPVDLAPYRPDRF